MKIRNILYVISAGLAMLSCDDNTSTLGVDIMPPHDFVTNEYKTYKLSSESYLAGDSVLARSSISYLGKFTDPETGTVVKSDFLAQFYCAETFSFPDSVINGEITSADLKLFVEDYIGDSLATFKLSVYPLNVVMDADQDYYTNIDPSKYCDLNAEPFAVKWFTLSDRTIEDEDRWSDDYYRSINISLPKSIGQTIYDDYLKNPSHFENTTAWVNSGLPGSKGFYFKLESGDGAIAYIDVSQFNINFNYYDENYKKDTLGTCQFASTEEVIQATRFENSGLEELMENKEATYLKTPAGIFTMLTLPIDSIHTNDTINSASITLTRYNSTVNSEFKLGIPQTLLMVRLDDYENGFFEKYQVSDNESSYVTSFNSSYNTYTFSNISRLLIKCMNEKKNGTATENWNKVLLIPVSATYDSSNKLIRMTHDFSMSSARLVGGKDKVEMDVIYSKFNR